MRKIVLESEYTGSAKKLTQKNAKMLINLLDKGFGEIIPEELLKAFLKDWIYLKASADSVKEIHE